jgi:hypothetical protein
MVTFTNALTTTKWVIDRVHRHTANSRAFTLPTRTACFTNLHVLVVCVSNLTD